MATVLFILGRPGSGKTTAANYINMLVKDEHLSTVAINDYCFLQQMFQVDFDHSKFLPTEHNGFDVIDFSVMNEALKEVEEELHKFADTHDFITIEFARDDYSKAMTLFSEDILKNCYFLYLDSDLEVCLARVKERVTCPNSADDHPSLSDDKFRLHYGLDNKPYIIAVFKSAYKLSDQQVIVIQNEGTKEEFTRELEQYSKEIILKTIKSDCFFN